MADSLRDQLVKAGLATTQQAKKAERQQRAENTARRHGQAADDQSGSGPAGGKGNKKIKRPADQSNPANVRRRAEQLTAEKAQRNRAIAQKQNEKSAARALRAEIKQIILQNDLRSSDARDDDAAYNFVHGKKIKKIYVPKAQRDQLSSGSLVIVNNDGRYHLLPRAAADQIAARDPKRIIVAHDKNSGEPTADDEHYARFAVPDDLDW